MAFSIEVQWDSDDKRSEAHWSEGIDRPGQVPYPATTNRPTRWPNDNE